MDDPDDRRRGVCVLLSVRQSPPWLLVFLIPRRELLRSAMSPRPFRIVAGVPRDDTIELLTPTATQPQTVPPMTARYQPDRVQGDAVPECHCDHGRSDYEALMSRKLQRSRQTSFAIDAVTAAAIDVATGAAIDVVTAAATGAVIVAVIVVAIGAVRDGPTCPLKKDARVAVHLTNSFLASVLEK
ncbi:hypothetical protein F5883DRAFT_613236 [Diaporthe sp. PMI_573]|nr:hypothetical protein F5883DRAFT_613236 [Diaporthaceae sp. PMI_573]